MIYYSTFTQQYKHFIHGVLKKKGGVGLLLDNPGSDCPSREEARNAPRLDQPQGDNIKGCPDNSSNFLCINFCNICNLKSHFLSVKHHLSFSKPHLFYVLRPRCRVLILFPSIFSILSFNPKLNVVSM